MDRQQRQLQIQPIEETEHRLALLQGAGQRLQKIRDLGIMVRIHVREVGDRFGRRHLGEPFAKDLVQKRLLGPRRQGPEGRGDIRKVWSPIGQRPLVKVHQRYEWSYLYAFARPNSGEVHWLVLPTVNAQVFSMALSNLAREVGAGTRKRILLVVDQAGWHTAKNKLKVPEGIHLEFLPSHSPELQPAVRDCGP